MNPKDNTFALILAAAFAVLMTLLFIKDTQGYDTVDDPCQSGGLEPCIMEPVGEQRPWLYPCYGIPMPEAWYCERRRRT